MPLKVKTIFESYSIIWPCHAPQIGEAYKWGLATKSATALNPNMDTM